MGHAPLELRCMDGREGVWEGRWVGTQCLPRPSDLISRDTGRAPKSLFRRLLPPPPPSCCAQTASCPLLPAKLASHPPAPRKASWELLWGLDEQGRQGLASQTPGTVPTALPGLPEGTQRGQGAGQGCAGHFSPAAVSCSPGPPDLSERF